MAKSRRTTTKLGNVSFLKRRRDSRFSGPAEKFRGFLSEALSNPLPEIRTSISSRPGAPMALEIDSDALKSNWRCLNSLSGNANAAAVVKANAYGLGYSRVVPHLHDAGCRDFFTSYLSEAVDLVKIKQINPGNVAFLHGPLSSEEALWAKALGIKPVINTVLQAKIWGEAGGGVCDVMIDTGINRIGLSLYDLSNKDVQSLDVDVLHSHLASADIDSNFNFHQLSEWQLARSQLAHRRSALANSAAIALGKDFHGDMTRPGIAIYGGIPRSEFCGLIKQVVYPKVLLMQVREIKAGETVGYNQTFCAQRDMKIGVVGIGYADGYLRVWSERGSMLHEGKRLPVLGRVSMDMTVVDLTEAKNLREGDWLDVDYDLVASSKLTSLSQYELLTLLADRFTR